MYFVMVRLILYHALMLLLYHALSDPTIEPSLILSSFISYTFKLFSCQSLGRWYFRASLASKLASLLILILYHAHIHTFYAFPDSPTNPLRDAAQKKNGIFWEFFPKCRIPSPHFGNPCFQKKKCGLFCIVGPREHFFFFTKMFTFW